MPLVLQILDLVPILAHQYFSEKLPVSLHGAQAAVLFCMGLQDKDVGILKVSSGLIACKSIVLNIIIKVIHNCYLNFYTDRKNWG
jgi:N-acetyltransferase 10